MPPYLILKNPRLLLTQSIVGSIQFSAVRVDISLKSYGYVYGDEIFPERH